MDEIKNKGGRPKKDPSRLLSETLQVKVTKKEWDLLDDYCQAQGIEKADYLRKSIFSRIHTWSAKNQPAPNPAPVLASSSHAETPKRPADPPITIASPVIVAEQAPELPVNPSIPENQAQPTEEPEKRPKLLEKPDYSRYGLRPQEEQTPAPEAKQPPKSQIRQIVQPKKPSDNQP
jgi:hypothetical protein